MSELLQSRSQDGLSEAEITINKLRLERMESATQREDRLQIHMGRLATPAGVLSKRDYYRARELAEDTTTSESPEQRQ